jgi:hypothetical protein
MNTPSGSASVIRRADHVKNRPGRSWMQTRRWLPKSSFFSTARREIQNFRSGIAGAG